MREQTLRVLNKRCLILAFLLEQTMETLKTILKFKWDAMIALKNIMKMLLAMFQIPAPLTKIH